MTNASMQIPEIQADLLRSPAVADQPPTQELSANAKLPTLIERATDALLVKAKGMTIATDEDYLKAGEFGLAAKAERERLEAERVEMKEDFLRGGQKVDAHYRGPLATLDTAIKQVKAYMTAYNEKKRIAAAAAQKVLDDQRAAAAAEAKKREDEALAKIRAEEQARLAAAEAKAAEERAKREQAEAQARKADEERQAAEARAAGDRAAAEAADRRAKDAEAQAEQAKQDAKMEREKAIEAKRLELKAQRETEAAVQTMDTAVAAASAATVTALAKSDYRVAGANDRITILWKWRLKLPEGGDVQSMIEDALIHASWLKLDEEKIQACLNKVKDKKLAQQLLGPSFEIWTEESIALKKGSKT